ncbi:NIPSNAP family protein [Mucilaginibacter sabulilitoris]|uniref:NIPSNAP family protein n=1 Tax=Mucilaginibacter sabulilitoris TaxID=1173583 RepID=A0ABZ0TGI6_9SPHI|nr:NIPSNAP family protein [Mucilaginibacter sabulilitoris]WPU92306.1 NIPSNAP family protein [Mucilaginibacter sabulilitoris]
MKLRYKTTLNLVATIVLMIGCMSASSAGAAKRYYYQLKVYHYKTTAQEGRIERYLEQAYVPAMHRAGISQVGVFKPIQQDTADLRIYVFTPFTSMDKLTGIDQKLQADTKYLTDGEDYIDADYKDAPYNRIETIVMQAFPKMPAPAVPNLTGNKADRVYELRSYESPTEKYNFNKVRMFNDGDEVGLFKRLGFNAVFYSEVIAGPRMPNLMYMTTFNDKADRDKHWDAFNNDSYWKSLSAKAEYQHNVSHADIIFLYPMAYSDF